MPLFWSGGQSQARRVELVGGPRDGDNPILPVDHAAIEVDHVAGDTTTTGVYQPREGHPHRLFWEACDGAGNE